MQIVSQSKHKIADNELIAKLCLFECLLLLLLFLAQN